VEQGDIKKKYQIRYKELDASLLCSSCLDVYVMTGLGEGNVWESESFGM